MRKILLVVVMLCLCWSAKSQILISEDFSNGIPASWTLMTDSNTAHNPTFQEAWVVNPNQGNQAPCAASTSWFVTEAQADRWLITNAVSIPSAGYYLMFDVASLEDAYPDGFEVRVSTHGATSRDDFDTAILAVPYCSSQFTEYMISLDDYVGEEIQVAFVHNSYDMNLLLLDNVFVGVPTANEIHLAKVYIPSTLVLNEEGTLSGLVTNRGMDTLHSFTVSCRVNGSDWGTTQINNINVPHGYSFPFTHNLRFQSSSMGTFNVELSVSMPNGVGDNTDDNTLGGSILVYDANLTVDNRPLVELMVLAGNANSPFAVRQIDDAVADQEAIILQHHTGHGQDDLTCDASTQLLPFYGSDYTFNPAVMYNRTHVDQSYPGPLMSVSRSLATVQSYVDQVREYPTFVTLRLDEVSYDNDTRQITGAVAGRFTHVDESDNVRYTVYLVEDSVMMPQFTRQGADLTFRHMNTVRAIVAQGDAQAQLDNSNNYRYPFSFSLPEDFRAWRCRVVAVVTNTDEANIDNNRVMNAAQSDLFTATYVGVRELGSNLTTSLFPNPARSRVALEASSSISKVAVVSPVGQVVYSADEVNDTVHVIDLSSLPAGIYLVSVTTAEGVATRRLSVTR